MLAILGDLLGAGIAAARLRQRIARTEVERERLRLAADDPRRPGPGPRAGQARDRAAGLRSRAGAGEREPRRACARRWARRTASCARGSRTSPRACRIGGLRDAVAAACERARERGLPVSCAARRRRSPPSPRPRRSCCASSARRWPTSTATRGPRTWWSRSTGRTAAGPHGRGRRPRHGGPRRGRARRRALRHRAHARARGVDRRPARRRPGRRGRHARPARGPARVSFAEAVEPRLDGGSCPHMAVVLRSGRELPAVLVSFYALGARRRGWVVHHAVPTQCDRDRERLTAAGLDVAGLEAAGEPRLLRVRSRRGARRGGRALRAAAGRARSSAGTARCGTRASPSGRARPSSPTRPPTTARGTRASAGAR